MWHATPFVSAVPWLSARRSEPLWESYFGLILRCLLFRNKKTKPHVRIINVFGVDASSQYFWPRPVSAIAEGDS